MKKILVATANYPDCDGGVSMMYVHIRNKYYIQHGLDVTVLNFNTKSDYIIDEIRVISIKTYYRKKYYCDILVCHAANLRNHFCFLIRFHKNFKNLIFFFHGHEVLNINKEYPKPFYFKAKGSTVMEKYQEIYDCAKLAIWRHYYKRLNYKSCYVFVSKWIRNKFFEYTKIKYSNLSNKRIINNSVSSIFEQKDYNADIPKKYDFITIRSDLDGSKYGIDIVNNIAKQNTELSFLVIGKGEYFKYNKKAENIILINHTLQHDEMLKYLDESRCALLLTREDTQGVMTCEMLTYGIPVITSDIDVCKEFFSNKQNCILISNDYNGKLNNLLDTLECNYVKEKLHEFDADRTILKEVNLFNSLIK